MDYWQRPYLLEQGWDYFLSLDVDYYLFQEARPTEKIKDDVKHLVWNEIGEKRNWGSGIYSKNHELTEEIINTEFKGSVAIANTEVFGEKLTLISLYGLLDKVKTTKYSITNLHRMLSDLTIILDGKVNGKRNIILGGDFNASTQWDREQNNNSHKIFFERLEDFNLADCYNLRNIEQPIQTLRKAGSDKPWQDDYFFIGKQWEGNLINCEVIDNERVRELSDHNPVIITVDL